MPEGLVSKASKTPVQEPSAAPAPAGNAGEEQATPEEQEAYEAAMQMVGDLVYQNDDSNAAIMKMLTPDDPAGSAADASAFVLSKIEETFQGNYPEGLVLTTADEISDIILELAHEAGEFEVTEEIAVQAKAELAQQLVEDYGVDQEAFQGSTQDVTPDDIAQYEQMFGGASNA